jgi:hypothetical protein
VGLKAAASFRTEAGSELPFGGRGL